MDEIQNKIGLWQSPATDAWLAETNRSDRPLESASPVPRPLPERTGPAKSGISLRVLPEHFAQPGLMEAFKEVRGKVLVAEGDSWFDFPVPTRVDLLDALNLRGRETYSLAYRGDTLENMVYGTQGSDGRPRGSDLDRLVTMVREIQPPVVLFSAGGNDVAGNEFHAFLNHKFSGRPPLREEFLREYVHEYVKGAYLKVANSVWAVAHSAKFIVHGYSYGKPTGLGVGQIFGWNLVGPWLKPACDAKGYSFAEGAGLVRTVINEFNAMLADFAREDQRVVYVDLRPHVGESMADWSDELHLNNKAVHRAAGVIDAAITTVLGH